MLRTNIRLIPLGLSLAMGAAVPHLGQAHEKFENLKVLKDNGSRLEKGMRELTKGLGVKCKSCHLKGAFEKDDIEAKVLTRPFLVTAMKNTDAEARNAALKPLLTALKLEKAKKPERIWKAFRYFEAKK